MHERRQLISMSVEFVVFRGVRGATEQKGGFSSFQDARTA